MNTADSSRICKDKEANSLVITQSGNGEEAGTGRILGHTQLFALSALVCGGSVERPGSVMAAEGGRRTWAPAWAAGGVRGWRTPVLFLSWFSF